LAVRAGAWAPQPEVDRQNSRITERSFMSFLVPSCFIGTLFGAPGCDSCHIRTIERITTEWLWRAWIPGVAVVSEHTKHRPGIEIRMLGGIPILTSHPDSQEVGRDACRKTDPHHRIRDDVPHRVLFDFASRTGKPQPALHQQPYRHKAP